VIDDYSPVIVRLAHAVDRCGEPGLHAEGTFDFNAATGEGKATDDAVRASKVP
jgi:hypothetical protein